MPEGPYSGWNGAIGGAGRLIADPGLPTPDSLVTPLPPGFGPNPSQPLPQAPMPQQNQQQQPGVLDQIMGWLGSPMVGQFFQNQWGQGNPKAAPVDNWQPTQRPAWKREGYNNEQDYDDARY